MPGGARALTLLAVSGHVWLLWVVPAIIVLVFIFIILKYFSLWIQCYMTQTPMTFLDLIGMSLRKVDASVIVESQITAGKAGLHLDTGALEAHYLARGNVRRVVRALIMAQGAGLELDFQRATGIDLAKQDVVEAVRSAIEPREVCFPDPDDRAAALEATAADGSTIRLKGRLLVVTDLERIAGGMNLWRLLEHAESEAAKIVAQTSTAEDVRGDIRDVTRRLRDALQEVEAAERVVDVKLDCV